MNKCDDVLIFSCINSIICYDIPVDKKSTIVGSYGPKEESQSYATPSDEMPKGMIQQGSYKVKSKFLDDDKNVLLEWDWCFDIKRDW